MKIKSIEVAVSHIVECDDGVTYRRNSAEGWEFLIGQSWEPMWGERERELELLFQQEIPSQWIPYKSGDPLPDVRCCWVALRGPFRRVNLASVDQDGKGGRIFYDPSYGSIDNDVTHYIPITTPELPK